MNRRAYLAAIGAAVVAGCNGDPDREYAAVSETTAETATATTATTKPMPSPPEEPTANEARAFVATHEERYVLAELVDDGYAVSVDVEPATARVFHETDEGYYLLSSCRGSAESSSGSGSMTRNASSIVHFVGPGIHKRVPHNWYACSKSGSATTAEDDADDLSARFQIYDLRSEIDYDNPDSGGLRVDVRVEREPGETILDRSYRTSLPLTVQPRVVGRPGRYALTATLEGGERAEHDWDLTTPSTPSWWGLAVFVTPDGDLFADVLDSPGALGLPERSLCTR